MDMVWQALDPEDSELRVFSVSATTSFGGFPSDLLAAGCMPAVGRVAEVSGGCNCGVAAVAATSVAAAEAAAVSVAAAAFSAASLACCSFSQAANLAVLALRSS